MVTWLKLATGERARQKKEGRPAEEITSRFSPHAKKVKGGLELKVCICLTMLRPLHHLHFLWLSSLGVQGMRPTISRPTASNQPLTAHSVSFTVVVVEGSVSVTHVTVCGFLLLFAVSAFALVRLSLFPVAPLVLYDVLQKDPRVLVGRGGGGWKHGGGETGKETVPTLPGRNLMTMRTMSAAQKMCRSCRVHISPLKK